MSRSIPPSSPSSASISCRSSPLQDPPSLARPHHHHHHHYRHLVLHRISHISTFPHFQVSKFPSSASSLALAHSRGRGSVFSRVLRRCWWRAGRYTLFKKHINTGFTARDILYKLVPFGRIEVSINWILYSMRA